MSKYSLVLLSALLGCLVAGGSAGAIGVDRNEVRVVRDIHIFAAQHPGLRIQPLEKQIVPGKARAGSLSVRYNLGSRISSDTLVFQTADTFEFPRAQDISVQLKYPEKDGDSGAALSYVELVCTQDDYDGTAYVVAGGIGQRFISIVLEAKNTKNFSYQALYYGQWI
ncbi:uncharacterized protein LOC108035825 [Drosophila biarmipes]|uniref:uncharacterized protein LOC108035825 n=1 Tax=Drosophila biarmipes TaxID=125945 RepID=UPI0007E86ED7|nr:uncharacterized protein LOC108035825 [Drosophila biarmipes]